MVYIEYRLSTHRLIIMMVAYLIIIIILSVVLAASADASFVSPAATKATSKQHHRKLQLNEQIKHQEYYRSSNSNLASREAAGISPGIGMWKDLCRSAKRRRRKGIVQATLEELRTKNSGRRRRRLSSRFRNYLKGRQSGANNNGNDGTTNNNNAADDEDVYNNMDVDSMRARSGVLRTRIRLRQGELTDLVLLMKDVSIELKRQQWENRDESNPGYKSVFSYDQLGKETIKGGDQLGNINDIMNENSLEIMNKQWREQAKERSSSSNPTDLVVDGDLEDSDFLMDEFQLELMKKRSLEVQSSILLDQIDLQRLERSILCCESTELGVIENLVGNSLERINEFDFQSNPVTVARRQAKKFTNTLGESTSVLLRKLDRVSTRSGKNNRDYKSVRDFVVQETAAGVRIVGNLLSNPSQLTQLIDPETPTLVPHVPAILSRLDRLETHVAPILSQVLNNKQHLRTIEPYLGEILERFDDIEPHLDWILDHIDILARKSHCILLVLCFTQINTHNTLLSSLHRIASETYR